jgi:D-alanine-D-alanine ligase
MASAVGMHKIASKIMVQSLDIHTAAYQKLEKNQNVKDIKIAKPYVVKPISEGSSVGISIVHPGDNHTGLEGIDPDRLDQYMVEAYVPGEELTVAVLNGKAQAVTAIKSETRFFDYHAKYRAEDTQYQLPAKIPHDVYQKAMTWSEDLYKALGCDGLARCDYRYNPQEQDAGHLGLYFLEINTQPGLTQDSIGPAQAGYNGISFARLCADMVHSALSKKQLL